jgi:hypothetical protein
VLHLVGDPLDSNQIYELHAGPWNWLGYPHLSPMSVETALGAFASQIVILQNDEGGIWIPSLGLNTIGNLEPGDGYMAIVDESFSFSYPPAAILGGFASQETQADSAVDEHLKTGLAYTVVLQLDDSVPAGSRIELMDGDQLVGLAEANGEELLVLSAWGGSPEHGIPGFTSGHHGLVILRDADGTELPVRITGDLVFGTGAFAELGLSVEALPTSFLVDPAYPNPFNPVFTVEFGLPADGPIRLRLFNLLGQCVYDLEQELHAGWHSQLINATELGMSSGMYILSLEAAGVSHRQKVMMVK